MNALKAALILLPTLLVLASVSRVEGDVWIFKVGPGEAPAGAWIYVRGVGYPNTVLEVYFGSVLVASLTTDRYSGAYHVEFRVPDVPVGVYNITVVHPEYAEKAWGRMSASFRVVEPKLTILRLKPEKAMVGRPVTVEGLLPVSNATIQISLDGRVVAIVETSRWGFWEATFNLPDVEAGNHHVKATCRQMALSAEATLKVVETTAWWPPKSQGSTPTPSSFGLERLAQHPISYASLPLALLALAIIYRRHQGLKPKAEVGRGLEAAPFPSPTIPQHPLDMVEDGVEQTQRPSAGLGYAVAGSRGVTENSVLGPSSLPSWYMPAGYELSKRLSPPLSSVGDVRDVLAHDLIVAVLDNRRKTVDELFDVASKVEKREPRYLGFSDFLRNLLWEARNPEAWKPHWVERAAELEVALLRKNVAVEGWRTTPGERVHQGLARLPGDDRVKTEAERWMMVAEEARRGAERLRGWRGKVAGKVAELAEEEVKGSKAKSGMGYLA